MQRTVLVPYNQSGELQEAFFGHTEPKDIASSITWATGEVVVRKDNGAEANATNLPVDRGRTFSWAYTASEATARK